MCAHYVCNLRKYDHISGALKSLHWLKISYRIDYKTIILVFKCLHDLAPKYLLESLDTTHHRRLRSQEAELLPIPAKCKLSKTLKCSFRQAAPRLWNSLPPALLRDGTLTLDNFKSKVKTHLFSLCYNC